MESSNHLPRDELMNDNGEEESQSGSDNLGGAGIFDDEGEEGLQNRRWGYHGHNPELVQELEAFFKEFPHPDDRQRVELSHMLGLGVRQIKFWFQIRRTQMKGMNSSQTGMMVVQESWMDASGAVKGSGSLVTLGFQLQVNTTPSAKLTQESFNTVHDLISFTIHKIKVALRLSQA